MNWYTAKHHTINTRELSHEQAQEENEEEIMIEFLTGVIIAAVIAVVSFGAGYFLHDKINAKIASFKAKVRGKLE